MREADSSSRGCDCRSRRMHARWTADAGAAPNEMQRLAAACTPELVVRRMLPLHAHKRPVAR